MNRFLKYLIVILFFGLQLTSCNIDFLMTGENTLYVINNTDESVTVSWYEATYDQNSNPIQKEHKMGDVASHSKRKFTFTDWDCDHAVSAVSKSGRKWRESLATCESATWTLEP